MCSRVTRRKYWYQEHQPAGELRGAAAPWSAATISAYSSRFSVERSPGTIASGSPQNSFPGSNALPSNLADASTADCSGFCPSRKDTCERARVKPVKPTTTESPSSTSPSAANHSLSNLPFSEDTGVAVFASIGFRKRGKNCGKR